jgi:hypothetical protein
MIACRAGVAWLLTSVYMLYAALSSLSSFAQAAKSTFTRSGGKTKREEALPAQENTTAPPAKHKRGMLAGLFRWVRPRNTSSKLSHAYSALSAVLWVSCTTGRGGEAAPPSTRARRRSPPLLMPIPGTSQGGAHGGLLP